MMKSISDVQLQLQNWNQFQTRNIPILPVGILDFCKQKLMAIPMVPMYMSHSWGILMSEQEEEHQTVKTKKSSPLREGPNWRCLS